MAGIGTALELRYRRTAAPRGYYTHAFSTPVSVGLNRDGSATLRGRRGQRVWADDRDPGFGKYLTNPHPLRVQSDRRRTMRRIPWMLLAVAGFLWWRARGGTPTGTEWWVQPDTGALTWSPGTVPPAPGMVPYQEALWPEPL